MSKEQVKKAIGCIKKINTNTYTHKKHVDIVGGTIGELVAVRTPEGRIEPLEKTACAHIARLILQEAYQALASGQPDYSIARPIIEMRRYLVTDGGFIHSPFAGAASCPDGGHISDEEIENLLASEMVSNYLRLPEKGPEGPSGKPIVPLRALPAGDGGQIGGGVFGDAIGAIADAVVDPITQSELKQWGAEKIANLAAPAEDAWAVTKGASYVLDKLLPTGTAASIATRAEEDIARQKREIRRAEEAKEAELERIRLETATARLQQETAMRKLAAAGVEAANAADRGNIGATRAVTHIVRAPAAQLRASDAPQSLLDEQRALREAQRQGPLAVRRHDVIAAATAAAAAPAAATAAVALHPLLALPAGDGGQAGDNELRPAEVEIRIDQIKEVIDPKIRAKLEKRELTLANNWDKVQQEQELVNEELNKIADGTSTNPNGLRAQNRKLASITKKINSLAEKELELRSLWESEFAKVPQDIEDLRSRESRRALLAPLVFSPLTPLPSLSPLPPLPPNAWQAQHAGQRGKAGDAGDAPSPSPAGQPRTGPRVPSPSPAGRARSPAPAAASSPAVRARVPSPARGSPAMEAAGDVFSGMESAGEDEQERNLRKINDVIVAARRLEAELEPLDHVISQLGAASKYKQEYQRDRAREVSDRIAAIIDASSGDEARAGLVTLTPILQEFKEKWAKELRAFADKQYKISAPALKEAFPGGDEKEKHKLWAEKVTEHVSEELFPPPEARTRGRPVTKGAKG